MVTKVRGSSQLRVANYTELRSLDSSKLADGQTIPVTNDGIAGQFVVKTGTVTDNGGTRLVFTDDSNRYVERVFSGAVNVRWFGATGDGSTSDSDAIQAAIDNFPTISASNPAGALYFPRASVGYRLTKPMWFYNKDNINLIGDGSGVTRFIIDATLDLTMPAAFTAINGAYNGYTYNATQAVMIFAARRLTQLPSQGYIDANGAARAPKMKGFRIECSGTAARTVSWLYAPEISSAKFEDIRVWSANNGQLSSVAYSSVYENVVFVECERPLDISNGTSLVFNRVSASHCRYGYKINTYYSTMNSVTIDQWGKDSGGSVQTNAYAYELSGIGWTLNSCGAEYGYTGLFKFVDTLPRTSIVLNGGAYWGGASTVDPAYESQTTLADFGVATNGMSYITNATVVFNGCAIRQLVENGMGVLTKFPIELNAEANVTVNGLCGFEGTKASNRLRWTNIEDFEINDSTAHVTPVTQRDKPSSLAVRSANQTLPANATTTIAFDTIRYDEYGNTQTNGITTIPTTGWYRLNADISLDGTGVSYIVITADDNELARWDSTLSDINLTKHLRVKITKGVLVRVQVRTAVGAVVDVRQDSSFCVEMC